MRVDGFADSLSGSAVKPRRHSQRTRTPLDPPAHEAWMSRRSASSLATKPCSCQSRSANLRPARTSSVTGSSSSGARRSAAIAGSAVSRRRYARKRRAAWTSESGRLSTSWWVSLSTRHGNESRPGIPERKDFVSFWHCECVHTHNTCFEAPFPPACARQEPSAKHRVWDRRLAVAQSPDLTTDFSG